MWGSKAVWSFSLSKLSTRIVPYFSNLIIWLSVASSGFEAAAWLRVSQPFSPEIDDNNQDQTSLWRYTKTSRVRQEQDNNQAQTSLHKNNLRLKGARQGSLYFPGILKVEFSEWNMKKVNYRSNIQFGDRALRHAKAGRSETLWIMVANYVSCIFIPNCVLDWKCIYVQLP